ncbi:MAG: CTP-dependent riboflavin kinase [Methanobacteriaceae archaeon]|nr:CTP-dependent riboflavin kinase [Methanobacteriaceae archaeon]
MKFKGIVVSGYGEGAYFMGLNVYQSQFLDKLGFEPYKGTLNIEISEETRSMLKTVPREIYGIIEGSGSYGAVKFLKATLNDKIDGAVIFPEKTHHPQNLLEFVAPVKLRDELKIIDGDSVTITFNLNDKKK